MSIRTVGPIVIVFLVLSPLVVFPLNAGKGENADGGIVWGPVIELSTDVSGNERQSEASMAIEGNELHVVWTQYGTEYGNDDGDIFYRHFNGTIWKPEVKVSTDTGSRSQGSPSIAVEKGEVYVVWQYTKVQVMVDPDWEIRYRHFNETSWELEETITTDIGGELQYTPRIAVDNGTVHVVYKTSEMGDFMTGSSLYYRQFNGSGWGPEIDIGSNCGRCWNPNIAAEDGKVHLVWEGAYEIFYKQYNGSTWLPNRLIIGQGLHDWIYWWGVPYMVMNDGEIQLAWAYNLASTSSVYYGEYNGMYVHNVTLVDFGDMGWGYDIYPSVDVDSGYVHYAWIEYNITDDLYYAFFDGREWRPKKAISLDVGRTHDYPPAIAANDGRVHIVWTDETDGDKDIYYISGIVDTSSPISNAEPISTYWHSNSPLSIGWSATDDKSLANISLQYRYSTDNVTWSGWKEYDYNSNISGTSSVGYFSFTPPDGDGFYEFYTIAVDDAGNGEPSPTIGDTRCGFDFTPPLSYVQNTVPYLPTSSPVTINATASDLLNQVVNVSLWYRYSPDNVSWSMWTAYAYDLSPSWSWDFAFSDGEGYYEFYSVSVDNLGNSESKVKVAEAIVLFATRPKPPSGLSAMLIGHSLQSIWLSWDLSPDDGAGRDNIVKYDVFRGLMYDSGGSGYIRQVSLPAGVSSYVDIDVGEGDPDNYFYSVCSVNVYGLSECSVDQAGKFTQTLLEGPKLVSIPLVQTDVGTDIVLQTLHWDEVRTFNSSMNKWELRVNTRPYSGDLNEVSHSLGLWVNVTSDSNLTVAGLVPISTDIQLKAGWNLVGFPSFNATYTVADLKAEAGATKVEGFDWARSPYYLKEMQDTDTLSSGFGYWIYVGMDTLWVVQNS